jgi:hypothetical protein
LDEIKGKGEWTMQECKHEALRSMVRREVETEKSQIEGGVWEGGGNATSLESVAGGKKGSYVRFAEDSVLVTSRDPNLGLDRVGSARDIDRLSMGTQILREFICYNHFDLVGTCKAWDHNMGGALS